MKLNFLNISPIALSALISTRLLAADELDQRVSQLEKKMHQVRTETAVGTYTASSGSAVPQNEGYGLFLTGDLLVWKLYEGTSYQSVTDTNFTSNNARPSPSTPLITNESIYLQNKSLSFNWDLGFKAGLGYVMGHDSWDAYLNYTQFKTHGSKSTTQTPPELTYFPPDFFSGFLLNYQQDINANNSVTTRRDVSLYMVDLELGKSFFITKYFSTRPFIGAKTAWLHQKLKNTNNLGVGGLFTPADDAITSVSGTILSQTVIEGKNNFWGIGPRAGVNLNWFFARYFNLYSNISGSVLWGNFSVRQTETTTANPLVPMSGTLVDPGFRTNTLTSQFSNELKASPHRFVPTVQLELGIEFNVPFYDNAYNLSIKAGYENQYWWRQNFLTGLSYSDVNPVPNALNASSLASAAVANNGADVPVLTADPRLDSPDDLGFHGFTLEIGLDF